MTRHAIVWIRHGTSIDGLERPTAHARPDTPLSDRGHAETREAAGRLAGIGIGRVVSSPLLRAVQTAQILAAELGIPLDEPDGLLREWQAPTCVLGLAPTQYPAQYRRWRSIRDTEPDTALPGGESLTAFVWRARAAAEAVENLAVTRGQSVLAVGHTLLIGAIGAIADGVTDPEAVFAAATCFTLTPAGLWHPPGHHHIRQDWPAPTATPREEDRPAAQTGSP
ncbi:histidine phosphatase family protein [Pseudonocardiaceae bacterium YIM PH 21723]|nr:histidine phosphatase family protein [Pseudonocardiaceae bacterium YIM PH 21723]